MEDSIKLNEWLKERSQEIYIDECYYCGSCGSHSHCCDANNGRCYECGADDWVVEPGKEYMVY